MRYRFLFILLLIGLSACTMQMEVITPTSLATEPGTVTFTPYVAATTTAMIDYQQRTATPAALPTVAFTSAPSSTPFPVDANITPIHFPPNGTYMDVVDSLRYGMSRTYSVAASKGQVMSVSVKQSMQGEWTVIPMQITGADGTVLCPAKADAECTSWRGILPSTQNYLIKLSPPIDVEDFALRVAINPPGVKTQSIQYVSPNTGSSFYYTDEFAPVRNPLPQFTKSEPEVVLAYIDTQAYTGTNLSEAYFLYSSSDEPAVIQNCTQPVSLGGLEEVLGTVEINGVTFVHSRSTGAATGNFYEQGIYRTELTGRCYEAVYVIHSVSAGAFLPTVIAEYDREALIQKFEAIVSTLVVK
jgi:hypothetical protein